MLNAEKCKANADAIQEISISYPYGRFYARSEKHLTDRLNEVVEKGRWMKTKRMSDTYGQKHTTPDKADKPIFGDVERHNDGWSCATQAYRGVIFQDKAAAVLAKMFVPGVEEQAPDEMVICRGFTTVNIDAEARRYGFGPKGMPWEDDAASAAGDR